MIETLGGAKYIEKDPPMVGDADLSRKVVDYLAYLKEQINFILSTNGRRVTKVSGEASSAAEAASSANYQEQLVYKSAAAGTATMAKPAAWVTDETGAQNTWTLKRPPYNSNYPVLFIATQRKSVGGEVSCTTPMIDDTTTVIDGGNIITGTVTANEIDIANLFGRLLQRKTLCLRKPRRLSTILPKSSAKSTALPPNSKPVPTTLPNRT